MIGEGATSGTASIAIYGDTLQEPDEEFWVRVAAVSGGALSPGGDRYWNAKALILNDD